MVWPNALARHFQAQVIQARERAQVRAIKDSIGHVEVFQMDGVGTPIIERPRPLPGHDTPNPANNTYTLNYEEPYKSAAVNQLPGAVAVMDPFHVVHIAIDALEQCRQRVQQETLGHRGRKGDPLYAARKTLLTGTDILTDTSQARLDTLFACPNHADVHTTWRIYQDLLAAYRE